MKSQTLIISAAINLVLMSSALAANDDVQSQTMPKSQSSPDAEKRVQPAPPKKKTVLPLDHGPHASVTPWVNQQRRLRETEEEKEKTAKTGS